MYKSGLALYIFQVVIDNGLIDLKVANNGCDKELPSEVSIEPSPGNRRKRRKHGSANGPFVEQHASVHSEFKEAQENQASISLKIAAVEALEALVIVVCVLYCLLGFHICDKTRVLYFSY